MADPRTGRQRRFDKPEAAWIVHEEERLRIVRPDLWAAVQSRRQAVRKAWPGGPNRRGFSGQQASRQEHFPTHLLSGTMTCAACGGGIAQVSGKSGGYYGCLAAAKRACDNRLLVRRSLVERLVLGAVRDRLSDATEVKRILAKVEEGVEAQRSDLPETVRL